MSENLNIVEYYKAELDNIKFEAVRSAVELVLNHAPSYYMTADTGNYAKDKDGKILKLRDFTKAVVRYLLIFLGHKSIRYQFTDLQRDYMIGAALIHDLAQRGLNDEPSKYVMFEHPILIANLIPEYSSLNPTMQEHIGAMINIAVAHNGPWNTSTKSTTILPEMTDNMQFYVHLSNYLASRKVTSIDTSDEVANEFKFRA